MNTKIVQKLKPKFDLGSLQTIIITFVIIVIIAVVGLQVLTDQQTEFTAGTLGYNATSEGLDAISKFPEKMPMLATVILGVVVIGIVISYFATKRR